MKVLKFIPPYSEKTGKPNFPQRGKSGVYIIKEDGKPVYIGFSATDLYKTMYRHFQEWNHTGQEVVSYSRYLKKHKYTVRVIYCTDKQAPALEKYLIKKIQPRDNANKYDAIKLNAYEQNQGRIFLETYPQEPAFTQSELIHLENMRLEEEAERAAMEPAEPEAAALFGGKKNNENENDEDDKFYYIETKYKTWEGIKFFCNKKTKDRNYDFWESVTHPKYSHFMKDKKFNK